jgi:transposase
MVWRVTDDLWERFSRHVPPHRVSPRGGRPPCDDRGCLNGIIFVLRSGTQWQMLPANEFGVSGSTCRRRFADWSTRGVWNAVHEDLLDELGLAGRVDLTAAAVIDSASVRAVFGGATPDRTRRTARRTAANVT